MIIDIIIMFIVLLILIIFFPIVFTNFEIKRWDNTKFKEIENYYNLMSTNGYKRISIGTEENLDELGFFSRIIEKRRKRKEDIKNKEIKAYYDLMKKPR